MFWREFSAFLANLSGMWWSHGVAEQTKLQLWALRMGWVWELPQVLGFRGSSVERTEPVPCQAAPGCWFRTQNFPLVHTWTSFHHQCEKEFAAFQSHPQIPHQKPAPNYTTGTNWIFSELFRREAKAWAAWKQNCPMNSPELPHGCNAARDSCGISKNTDFTF